MKPCRSRYILIWIALLLVPSLLQAQIPSSSQLEEVTIDDGLSQGYISCILQDSEGFMWFGTLGGLNRYDGYDFKVYQHQPGKSNSLSGNNISALYEDSEGLIWIGTWGQGINVLDRQTERIYKIEATDSAYSELADLHVWQFLKDASGNMWIGGQTPISSYGLFKLEWDSSKLQEDEQTKFSLTPYQLDPDSFPQHNDVFDIHIDQQNRMWVGTTLGLYSTNLNTLKLEFTLHNDYLADQEMPHSGVFSIFEEGDLLWLGRAGTIQTFNTKTHEWGGRPPTSHHPKQVWVEQLSLDRQGRFWFVDRWGRGLYVVDKDSVSTLNAIPEASVKAINAVLVDQSNVVWMGRTSRGLYKFSPSVNQFSPLLGMFTDQPQAYINHVHEDHKGRLWADNKIVDRKTGERNKPDLIAKRLDGFRYATVDRSGVFWAMPEKGQLWGYNLETNQERFFNYEKAATPNGPIYADITGILWWGSQGTLHRFDPNNSSFRSFSYDPNVAANPVGTFNFILKHGANGHLWMGTQQGLIKFNEADEKIETFRNDPQNPKSLSGDRILSVLDDPTNPSKFLWVGTEGGGLNLMNKVTGESERFTTEHGLPDNTIYGILSDDNGNLWMSTNRGLVRFNTQTRAIRIFDKADGLQNNEFNRMAYFKSANGELFFAGVNGINAFYPEEIVDNPQIPTIAITEFRIGNQPISHLDSASVLTKSINATTEIHLSHEQNMISFVYAALDYVNPGKNQYAYQMKGLSDQWIQAENSRLANFTNLDPGTYTFTVKGTNNDGLWNEQGASVKIIITPPWWQTWWAYGIYLLLIIAIVAVIIVIQMRRVRLRNQLLLEQQTAESLRALEDAKNRFFSNITHEFRTPLTLILGPVEELLRQNAEDKTRASLESIQRQSKHLLGLINQLLDISKLENERMPLELSRGNINSFIQDITLSFNQLAQHRQIQLSFDSASSVPDSDFDSEKLEKIIRNLLSNALKFTQRGGTVLVKTSAVLEEPDPWVSVMVTDTGPGISEEDLPNIFDRFYQAKSTQERHTAGTGIGLALSKELAQLMGGTIQVKSKEKEGSKFILHLPFQLLEKSEPKRVSLDGVTNSSPEEIVYDSTEPDNYEPIEGDNRDLVLLVEDHAELRDFVKSQLHPLYTVIEATNGQTGLDQARNHIPDLIITDVMMPEMDGYEFCQHVKGNELTSHIPVIMLTAKSTTESRLQGLEEGADAYLTKPFNRDELLLRIRKLLETRKLLQEKYQRLGTESDSEDSTLIESKEHVYLSKAKDVVEKFLDDPDFDVEAFCQEMGMSRTQLHRKLKALTNQSTTGFVRSIRLKTARQLLENGAGNVTEVAYAVGFSSPPYFSKCFQEKFGVSPKDALPVKVE